MDIATFADAIGTLGFPIVCVGALGFFVWQLYKQSVAREDKLFEELSKSHAINGQFAELIADNEVKLDEIRTDVKEIKTDIIEIKNS